MFSAIRRRITPSTFIATLALVLAMGGGAYAAKRYLITSTKQISPSVLKSLRAASGKAGAPGATGPAGSAGPSGAMGPAGPAGPAGGEGKAGPAGTSVTAKESKTKIGPCEEGGSEFTAGATKTYACNGEQGPKGTAGAPGPEGVCAKANCVLPSGTTETGAYSGRALGENEEVVVPISFPIRLAKAPVESQFVTTVEVEGHHVPSGCTVEVAGKQVEGSPEDPVAAPGNLCVYGAVESVSQFLTFINPNVSAFNPGVGTTGAIAAFRIEGAGTLVVGAWAVTAE